VTQPLTVDELGLLGQRLGEGGQAEVYELPDRPGLVFKRYHSTVSADGMSLDRLIVWPQRLSPAEARVIEEVTCWPKHRVVDGRGRLVGLTIPRVPPEFYVRLSTGVTRPSELQYLLRVESAARLGFPPVADSDRVTLATMFVEVLDIMARHSLILGDISERNWLWTLSVGCAAVRVLDCDAARLCGRRAVLPGSETPGWQDPLLPSGAAAGEASDRFKLCLVVYRLITGDFRGTTVNTTVTVGRSSLPPGLADLLRAGLSGTVDERPPPAALLAELRGWVPKPALVAAGWHGGSAVGTGVARPSIPLASGRKPKRVAGTALPARPVLALTQKGAGGLGTRRAPSWWPVVTVTALAVVALLVVLVAL
jgi:hypothetical protein